MTMNRSIMIVLILGMLAVMCGTVSAAMGIGAENENPSAGTQYPACPAQCECISMNEAAQRWGAEGYETCSKSVCGQSANAMTQYYCIHAIGGSTSSPGVTTCQAPCECLSDAGARIRWGANGYTQCSKTTCGQETTNSGTVARYCYRQFGSTLLIGGAAASTVAPTASTWATVQAPVQTQPQAQTTIASAAAPVTPSPSYTWPAANAPVQQRTPVGIATIIAAIGAALVAAVVMRKE